MNQRKLLLDIVCTSRNVSHYHDSLPSLKEASILLLKIEKRHDQIAYDSKKACDGIDEKGISNPEFEKKKQRLQQMVNRYKQKIEGEIPSNKDYKIYSLHLEQIKSDGLKAFGIAFNRYCQSEGDEIRLTDFPKRLTDGLMEPLLKLGEAAIKLEVIQQVEEDVTLGEEYHFYTRFDSVPDACNYYADILGDDITREALKDKIKRFARIIEDGKEIDWPTTNKRINSWADYEGSKYNKEEIPLR